MHMKNTMNLKNREVEQLRQSIILGIYNKFFGKHNISITNNYIHSIEGLLWNEADRVFYIDPRLSPNQQENMHVKVIKVPS